jgi:hypothetical protein
MSINRPPKNVQSEPGINNDAISSFIQSAPDGSKKKGVVKGKRQQITVTIVPEVIDQLDTMAAENGLSRAGLINIAIRQLLSRGINSGEK